MHFLKEKKAFPFVLYLYFIFVTHCNLRTLLKISKARRFEFIVEKENGIQIEYKLSTLSFQTNDLTINFMHKK